MNMKLKVSRFVYSYLSAPEVVEDYILRSDDSATKTYGTDLYFSRLSQVLDQARFLGWHLPQFGRDIPSEFTEIPLEGINHLFESQVKLLVDVAPTTLVTLVSEKKLPVKMVCGTTPAGDLVWRLSLLSDSAGNPYVQSSGEKLPVKTSGTRIVCSKNSINYSEQYLIDCFGGDSGGVWPMPFLPECFVDKAISYSFRPEDGVVEVVNIEESDPVRVIAVDRVPWYRNIEVDRTKALPESSLPAEDVDGLISGWADLQDNDMFEIEESEETDTRSPHYLRDEEKDFSDEYSWEGDHPDAFGGSEYEDIYYEPRVRPSQTDNTIGPAPPVNPVNPANPANPAPPVHPAQPVAQPAPVPLAEAPAKKEPEISFKIKVGRGRPRKAPTYEKAMSIVARNEKQGKKCEVYSSESSEAVYITGIGELK